MTKAWRLVPVLFGVLACSCLRMESPPDVGLAVGNAAHDVKGRDADGLALKLSDYRGKVVLLDFWQTY